MSIIMYLLVLFLFYFQTLQLLFNMANSRNALVISTKLTEALVQSRDSNVRAVITAKLFSIAKRNCSNIELFLKITSDLAMIAENVLPLDFEAYLSTMIKNILEPSNKIFVVRYYWGLLQKEKLCPTILKVAFWVSYEK